MFITRRALLALSLCAFAGAGLAGCGGGSNNLPTPGGGGGTLSGGPTPSGRIVYSQGEPITQGNATVSLSGIYLRNADGSGQRRLVAPDFNTTYSEPALSPDGRHIAFISSNFSASQNDIYTIDTDGSNLRRVTDDALIESSPEWTPDGASLIYSASATINIADNSVYRVRVDGSGTPQLLLDNARLRFFPALSPDGRTLAYFAPGQTPDSPNGSTSQIYLEPLDGSSAPRQITSDDTSKSSVAFSPNGRQLAFTTSVNLNQPVRNFGGKKSVVISNLDGSKRRTLPTSDDSSLSGISWSPDGNYLAYVGDVLQFSAPAGEITGKIFLVRTDGQSASRLLGLDGARGGQFGPSWGR